MSFTVGAAIIGVSFAGCGQLKEPEPVGKTQLKLTMDIRGATNVGGMRFEIQPVGCEKGDPWSSQKPVTIERALEDLQIPSDVPAVANMPLAEKSSHVFADAFVALAPGCYDVKTTPLTAKGELSKDCAPAHLTGVRIWPQKTTEVFLINQCDGIPTGAIDIASALNHPPQIRSVMFSDSKFVERCTPQTVCATAFDSDSDPIEWSWSADEGPAHAGPVVVSTTENKDGSVTQCVQLEGREEGKLEVTVTVYDLVTPDGKIVERVETWLAEQGYPGESHASLTFPFYVSATGRTPSAEVCDDVDNDCDLETDEGDVCKKTDPDPECAGQTCGTFTACNEGGSCSARGVCGSTAEGGGLCVDGLTSCIGLADCPNGSSDCEKGAICFVQSCCGRPVCVPQARFCSNPPDSVPRARFEAADVPMSVDAGPTIGRL